METIKTSGVPTSEETHKCNDGQLQSSSTCSLSDVSSDENCDQNDRNFKERENKCRLDASGETIITNVSKDAEYYRLVFIVVFVSFSTQLYNTNNTSLGSLQD